MKDSYLNEIQQFVKQATSRNVRLRYSSILNEWMIEVLWADEIQRFGSEVQMSIMVDDLDFALKNWENKCSEKK